MGYFKTNYIILCKDITTHDDGTNTYHNVFDILNIDSFPFKMDFLVMLGVEYNLKENDNRHFYFHIRNPKGKKIGDKIKHQLKPSDGDKSFMEGQFRFKNFPVDSEGYYEFYVTYNDEIVGNNLVYIKRSGEGESFE